MNSVEKRIAEAIQVLKSLGLPRAQQNERSALCLLALLDLKPEEDWSMARNPMLGITPIMDWARVHYGRSYAPNTRETFRRQSMHQFCDSAIVVYNPDNPSRPVNSPKAVYQVDQLTLALLRKFNSQEWDSTLEKYLVERPTLISKYAVDRQMNLVPVRYAADKILNLSAGEHSALIRDIVESFGPRFAPDSKLIYAGDTGTKWGYFDHGLLKSLNVEVDSHGKMPDVVLFYEKKNWLVLIEAVTSHGPVDGKRHAELKSLFSSASVGVVYVTAFPNRSVFSRYVSEIAWETEVWVADAPTHLIHFNGVRFLGPY